eukprot:1182483-Prorocentrum_minimum.AAC.2
MNFRSTAEFKPPFRVFTTVDEVGPYICDVVIKVRLQGDTTGLLPQDREVRRETRKRDDV